MPIHCLKCKPILILFLLIILFIVSCKNNSEKNTSSDQAHLREIDTSSVILKYNNTLFTIPSPFQVSSVIKSTNIEFNKELINLPDNVSNYTTNFKQSLNIGIYGTDLGYLNIYDQIPDIISYFTVIKKLSEELGISDAIQYELIDRIEKNIDNQDSLLFFLTNTYREFDKYLKNNNRKDVGVLIIAGGWIESLYILSHIANENKRRIIINRLGEQKHPLDNLIELLSPYYYKSKEYSLFIDDLVDLAYEFDGIILNYSYEESIIFPEKQLTIINSFSNVIISEYHLRTIETKISAIRNKIIN